jgi:hypothetical protein
MSRSWLAFWCVVIGVMLVGTALGQDQVDPRKWSIDPRATTLQPSGEFVAPRQHPNYVPPKQETRVFYTPFEMLSVTPNQRVHPSTTTSQSEVPITRHPTNGNILYASSNAVHFTPSLFISEGMYLSTDGGTTWFGSDTTAAAPLTGHSGDPAPAIGPDGRLYMSNIISGGMGVEYSTDMGSSWSSIITLASGSQDKNHTFVNDVPSSPYYGRAYVTWSLFTASNPPAVVSYTTNLGATWTAPINILAPPSGRYQQGVNGAVGANGDAYICWQSPQASSPFTGLGVGFAKSTDGGATWSGSATAYPSNGARNSSLSPWGIRINDFPSMAVDRSGGGRNGWIYIVTCEKSLAPAGSDEDIVMHFSSDGGATWSAGTRVNQDALNNGKKQYMPWMCVDAAGGLNVVYYDNRNSAAGDSVEVIVSRSLDGGTTWNDIVVSDHKFRPAPIPGLAGGYQGDYIGITAANGKIYPYWADNSTGIYQAWVTSVTTTENFGWVKGTITNTNGGAPLQGVNLDFTEPRPQVGAFSDAAGYYKAGAKVDTPGTTVNVTLRARKFGFRDTTLAVTLTVNDTITRNFAMAPVPSGTLVVRTVRTDSSNIQSGISVLFNGTEVASGNTDPGTGVFSAVLPFGTYSVIVDPPSPYGNRRFNGVVVASGNNPLYVVVRAVVENSPSALRDTLAVGQVHAKNLALTNTTSSDTITYRLSDDVTAGKMRLSKPAMLPNPTPFEAPQRAKGAVEPMGIAQTDSAGGPDGFGYRWIDSDSPGGPVFNWFDIDTTGLGTPVTFSTLDDGNASIPLSMPFTFYGNTYSSTMRVCTNGWVSFTSTSTAYSNESIPSTAEPNNAIYAFWEDLNLTSGGSVKYYYDSTNTRFIIQYTNVPFYSGTGTNTFQVILHPNGQVVVQYLRFTGETTSATVGIENANGTVALQVVNSAAYLHNNLALKYYLPGAPWLSESPESGRINPNSTANVTVTFDANGLTQGTTYTGKIILDATHPDVSGSVIIPASLTVNTATVPTISVNPTSLTFPTTIIGNTRRDSVRVRNVGIGTLTISSVTTSNPRFSATITSTSLTTGDSARIRVVYTPVVPAGPDTGRVIVLSNDVNNPRVDIPLNGTSLGAPLFRARLDSLVKPAMEVGTADSIRFYVRNAGTAASPFAARAYMYPRGDAQGSPFEIPMSITRVNPYASTTMASTPATGLAPRFSTPASVDESHSVRDILQLVGENAFCANVNTGSSVGFVDKFSLTTPGTFVNLANTGTTYSFAGDFGNDGVWYAITYPANNLIRIDTTSGTFTTIGACTPANAETWTILEIDPTSGIAYGASAGPSSSTWYTINLATAAATVVGTISGAPNMISGAFDNSGQFYGLEQTLDNLVRIDKNTGAATVIGAIGFDARFAQDADFDYTSGTLYLAAYNNTTSRGELRTANLSTGATTLIAPFPTSIEVTNLAINSPTGPVASWLSIAPTSGGPITMNDSTLFTARFDATSPEVYNNPGNYFGRIEINPTVTPAPDTLKLPVRMFVVPSVPPRLVVQPDSVNVGNVEIGRTDSSKTILVKNIGQTALTVTNVAFTGGTGFGLSRTSFTLNSLDSLRLPVLFSANAPGGVRTARMHWVSNDPLAQSIGLRAVSVGVAHVSVRPDTFYFATSGMQDTTLASFTILSTGTDTLRYEISEASSLALDAAAMRSIERSRTQQPAAPTGKGVIDPNPGEGGFDGQGGPDAFGYRWIDSDEPGGPTFSWVDISTVGTAVTFSSLDDGNATIPFPFNFSYYGSAYSGNINVCTNGWLSFTSTATLYTNSAIPSTTAPLNGIFPFWDDMNLTSGGTVYYYHDAANNRFIVEYLNVPHYSSGELYTFEVIMKPDGTILFQYLTMDPALLTSATIGVQNETGTVGLQVVYNAAYVHDNLAVMITSDILPWMSTNVTEGVIGPGDSSRVTLRVHGFGTPAGTHTGYQRVRGNTPDTTANVRVRISVPPPPNSVTVTSPNGGETWAQGSTQAISWVKTGNVDTVKIELSTSGSGGPWSILSAGVPAKVGQQRHPKTLARPVEGGTWDNLLGTFSWTIPTTTPLSTNSFIKITQKSNSGISDISNAAFTITEAGVDTSWVVQTSGTTVTLYAVKAVSQNVAWAAGGTGVVRRTTDGGFTWTSAGSVGADIYTMTALDANVAFVASSPASGAAKIWKTTNGGTSWVAKDSTGVFWNYIHMFDATNGYAQGDPPAVGQNWVLKRTTNGGETWVNAATVPTTSEAGWNNSMMWLNGSLGWFGTNASKIYRTTDGGSTWLAAPTNLGNANSFAVSFNSINTGLAASQTGTMNRSIDTGATWTTGPASVAAAVYGMWGNPGTNEFWAIGGNNVNYSSNSGTSWSATPRNGYTGTSGLNHVSMVRAGNNLYGWASGAAGKIVRFNRIATGSDENPVDLPTSFTLRQNYPNPFNPTTTIRYDLPEQATVVLKVYNVLGQEVATLFNGQQQAGFHQANWDGHTSRGVTVSSGVYFYRFEATSATGQTFSSLKKMMFLK